MTMQKHQYSPALFALLALAFAGALLAHEHFHGGVRSHHLLDRRDLPAISNWFGLVVLPALGWLLGLRLRQCRSGAAKAGTPTGMVMGLVGAVLYGAALATSFTLGAFAITSGLFFGLFVLAAVWPLYRVEFIFGFVVGMAFTFGAVLPALVALVIAAVSALLHFAYRAVMAAVRPSGAPPRGA